MSRAERSHYMFSNDLTYHELHILLHLSYLQGSHMMIPCYPLLSLSYLHGIPFQACRRAGLLSRNKQMASLKIWAVCTISLALGSLHVVISEETCSRGQDTPALPAALQYLEEHKEEAQQDVLDLVTIPSISSMSGYKEHVREAGQWLVRRLRRAGLEVSSHTDLRLPTY